VTALDPSGFTWTASRPLIRGYLRTEAESLRRRVAGGGVTP